MLFNQYLKTRKSVRDYKNKSLSENNLQTLQNHMAKTNAAYGEKGIEIMLLSDGAAVYALLDGEGGYQGRMIQAPHYIGVCIKDSGNESLIAAAYALSYYEKLSFDMGLGSCWINLLSLSDAKKAQLLKGQKGDIHFLLAVGESEEERIGTPKETANRFSVEEIVFLEDFNRHMSLSEMTTWGLEELFYNVRNVPTNMNRQPWRFVVDNDVIKMYVVGKDDIENLTDAGIMMYNFEQMAHDLGIRGEWQIMDGQEISANSVRYFYVGLFDM